MVRLPFGTVDRTCAPPCVHPPDAPSREPPRAPDAEALTEINDNRSYMIVRSPSPSDRMHELSGFQLAILQILWDRGEASAAEVQRALRPSRRVALTTVSTMLQRLEKRGVVTHRTEGRGFVYMAAVAEHEVRRSMFRDVVQGLFRGDAAAVVTQVLSARDLKEGDIERIQRLLDEARQRRADDDDA
jgi:BlaI family transcriptional regulator, penicillinase repressor